MTVAVRGAGVRFDALASGRPLTPVYARLHRRRRTTWGVRGLDLEIAAGEGVALIGPSGAGKSTLLRLAAGVYPADEGSVEVHGPVASLLAVDAGLHSTLTGAENAELMHGLTGGPRDLSAVAADAGLGDAFDRPVATWSQGMRARLTFALGMQRSPSVLLLDEVHEAFDQTFRDVLEERVAAVRAGGGAVLAASHDLPMLSRLCDRAVVLDRGSIVDDGPFDDVRARYEQ